MSFGSIGGSSNEGGSGLVNPPVGVWANRATLITNPGICRFSDIADGKNLFYYTGSSWVPLSPITLMQKTEGYIVASLTGATYTQTGDTITVTLANHRLVASLNTKLIYLTGTGGIVAGWYPFTYVDASTFTCVSPISQSISGAINNTLGTYLFDIANVTLPDGFFSGRLLNIEAGLLYEAGSISTKTPRLYLNNTNLLTHTIANNTSASVINWTLVDNGQNKQTAFLNSGNLGSGTAVTGSEITIGTTATVKVGITLTTSLTYAVLDYIKVSL